MNIAVGVSEKDLSPSAVMPAHRDLYFAGEWQAPRSGRYVETINPASGEAITEVADAGADDAVAAIQAAHEAFEGWRPPSRERGRARDARRAEHWQSGRRDGS